MHVNDKDIISKKKSNDKVGVASIIRWSRLLLRAEFRLEFLKNATTPSPAHTSSPLKPIWSDSDPLSSQLNSILKLTTLIAQLRSKNKLHLWIWRLRDRSPKCSALKETYSTIIYFYLFFPVTLTVFMS